MSKTAIRVSVGGAVLTTGLCLAVIPAGAATISVEHQTMQMNVKMGVVWNLVLSQNLRSSPHCKARELSQNLEIFVERAHVTH